MTVCYSRVQLWVMMEPHIDGKLNTSFGLISTSQICEVAIFITPVLCIRKLNLSVVNVVA